MPSAALSLVFISPSVREGGRLADAISDSVTIEQENFERTAEELSAAIVPGSTVRRAIGVWLDGAEASACIEAPWPLSTIEDLQYIAALLGVKFRQKDALVFWANPDGQDRMHAFTAPRDGWAVDRIVRAAGIEHRTYILSYDNVETVYVFDNGFDTDLPSKLNFIGERHGYAIRTQQGTGDFITSFAESREQGKKIFQQLIDEYERRHPDRKRTLR